MNEDDGTKKTPTSDPEVGTENSVQKSDDSESEGDLDTTLSGVTTLKNTTKEILKRQFVKFQEEKKIEKEKRKEEQKQKLLENDIKLQKQKYEKRTIKKRKRLMLQENIVASTKEASRAAISSCFAPIPSFSGKRSLISKIAEDLEDTIFEANNSSTKGKYFTLLDNLKANIAALSKFFHVSDCIAKEEIPYEKLKLDHSEFVEKCTILEARLAPNEQKPKKLPEKHIEEKSKVQEKVHVKERRPTFLPNECPRTRMDMLKLRKRLQILAPEAAEDSYTDTNPTEEISSKNLEKGSQKDFKKGSSKGSSQGSQKDSKGTSEQVLIEPIQKCIEEIRAVKTQHNSDKPEEPRSSVSLRRTQAIPGSLLRVGSYSITHSRGYFGAEMVAYSTSDINLFQSLPKIPRKLTMSGVISVKEVEKYLIQVGSSFPMVMGWMEHNTPTDQDFYIKSKTSYCHLWSVLSPKRKCGVLEIFTGFKLYVIPMDGHNKQFFNAFQLKLYTHQKGELVERGYPLDTDKRRCFAFLGLIKSKFYNRTKFLDPKVLCEAKQEEETEVHDQEKLLLAQDAEFISDIVEDFEAKIIPYEDLYIRLENCPDQDRLSKALNEVGYSTKRKFEQFIEAMVSYRDIKNSSICPKLLKEKIVNPETKSDLISPLSKS
ncbi:unnamed protein product [Moneuplotes crassus]|uniref:Uncharacterized protein n=1 Tax=Euplotes crassus TaxID=5936 RepID=A0AAD1XFE0_EUPCR|nr:unnamed protein product [Moneuplotes crassus]